MRRVTLIVVAGLALLLAASSAQAQQQFDVAFGLSTLSSTGTSTNVANALTQPIGGGAFLAFSGDFLLRHHMGVQGEIAWRASQNTYQGVLPYRPLFYDFNGIWAPALGKWFEPELMAGIGAESVRFYQPTITCSSFSCTNYTSTTHFLGDVGGGLRFYPKGHFFIRPEARLYLVHNNVEFSSGRAVRYGVSIGYTMGGER